MFRLQNNVPDVYVDSSRDFQLFCRLFDFLFNGVKFDIDCIINSLNAFTINERLLTLLGTKLGFYTNYQYDSKTLRYILSAFPFIIKYKGTRHGIELAVYTILRLEGNKDTPNIDIINKDSGGNDVYQINITTTSRKIESRQALLDLLNYVVPTGYIINITHGVKHEFDDLNHAVVETDNNYDKLLGYPQNISRVYGNYNDINNDMEKNYISSFYSSEVIGANNFKGDNTNAKKTRKK